jgi:2-oxoglutarate dehydrogenase E1 component
MQICNCTTPAQYFHLLRRQMREGADMRGKRKPLVIFTPKSLLRHPKATSTFDELASGSFRDILHGAAPADLSQVTRLLFCSGKVYYDLLARFEAVKPGNMAIVRVEQLYPFNTPQLSAILAQHPNAADRVWVQEEPRNMGAWGFMRERIAKLRYVGRDENSSPATGSKKLHDAEQAALVDGAFAP